MKICVYAICKDELKHVDAWYESMKEADYVVVLDTGSTDGTYEKLQSLGLTRLEQKVISPWRFDVARNESMKLIPEDTDVCVCTDFDETLDRGWASTIRKKWQPGKHLQGIYRFFWKEDEKGNPIHEFQYGKIHCNDGHWYWKYPVHEDLLRDTKSDYPADAVCNLLDSFILHHHQDDSKVRPYTDLLEVRVAENPDQISKVYLGIAYANEKRYKEAIQAFEDVAFGEDDGTLRNITEKAYACFSAGVSYALSGNTDRAMTLYNKAMEIDPTFRDSYVELAKVYISMHCFSQAEQTLKECMDKTQRHYIWIEQGIVWGSLPYQLLTIACMSQGKLFEAKTYLSEAEHLEPENPDVKKLREFINKF